MAATKIDYEALASEIKKQIDSLSISDYLTSQARLVALSSHCCVAQRMANHFARTNKKFDRIKFLKSCGIES